MKEFLTFVLFGAFVAASFAGCGGGDSCPSDTCDSCEGNAKEICEASVEAIENASGSEDLDLDNACPAAAAACDGGGNPGNPEECQTMTDCDPNDFDNPAFCDEACPSVCRGNNSTANTGMCSAAGTCVCDCFEGCL